jgi:hypothetical protein
LMIRSRVMGMALHSSPKWLGHAAGRKPKRRPFSRPG